MTPTAEATRLHVIALPTNVTQAKPRTNLYTRQPSLFYEPRHSHPSLMLDVAGSCCIRVACVSYRLADDGGTPFALLLSR